MERPSRGNSKSPALEAFAAALLLIVLGAPAHA